VVRAMRPVRCRLAARSAALRNPLRATLIALVLVVSGLGLLELPSGASGGDPTTAAPSVSQVPATVTPPSIYSFYASPSEFFVGSLTHLSVGASGSGTLSYAYLDLPPGCASSNTADLACTPTSYGAYNVTVVVSEAGTTQTARSSTTMLVDRVVTGTFFSLNGSVATWATPSAEDCQSIVSVPFYQNFCSPQAQQPTLLPLAGGVVGLSYQLETTVTSNHCSAASATLARVAFQTSADNGSSFGSVTNIGNDTCTYLDAIEPSFAVGGTSVYGAFVEENSSVLPSAYVARSADALGFVRSTNDGTSFSTAVTLSAAGNIAHPEVAAVGSTVYLVYEDIANSSTPIAGGVLPISLHLLTSTNGGVSWRSSVTLPGLGAAMGYTSASPSIAVNASGAVTVVYASDRVCLSTGSSGCTVYGDSIVESTSTDNGTVWGAPKVIATGAGETACFTGACGAAYFQSTPEITFGYSPSGSDLYVVYAATYNQGAAVADNFNHTGLFAAVSTNSGASWIVSAIDAAPGPSSQREFEPALAVGAHFVYLSFLVSNESVGLFGFANSLSDFVQTVPTGAHVWSAPTATDIESFTSGGSVNATRTSSPGYASSVALLSSGRALIAFALPGAVSTTITQGSTYYYANTSYPTALVVGALLMPTDPDALAITFTQTGIPTGVSWQLTINGITYLVSTPSIEFTDIPANVPVMLGAYYAGGFWTIVTTYYNATLTSFSFDQTYTFAFEVWVGLTFDIYPSSPSLGFLLDPFEDEEIQLNVINSPFYAYVYDEWFVNGEDICNPTCGPSITETLDYFSAVGSWYDSCTNLCNWTTPFYFPLGSTLNFTIPEWESYFGLTPVYLSGTGAGAYNGPTQTYCSDPFDPYFCTLYAQPITMLGPVNETLWLSDAPVNLTTDLTVTAPGLPSSSVYHFSLNGQAYSGTAPAAVVVDAAPPGAYIVSSVWATSSRHGWEYFGQLNGPNPFLSPVLTSINLTFPAFVNMSSSVGVVEFHAPALSLGTSWSIDLNGTTYTSNTPFLNVSTRDGTYAYSVGDATSASGTTGYVPSGAASPITVDPGNVYTVTFVPAFQVEALASTGGYVALSGQGPQIATSEWVAAGARVSIDAILTSGYTFIGWSGTGSGSYSGTSLSTNIFPQGPVVESATFQPQPGARFNLTVQEAGLPSGTWWTANVGGAGHSTNTSSVTVSNLWPWSAAGGIGQYSFTVPVVYVPGTNLTRYVPSATPATVGTNGTFTPPLYVTFAPQSLFQLDALSGGIAAATYGGAPVGTSVWVTPGGAPVSIVAISNPGYVFVGWQGTGAGSYSGPLAQASVVADGPVTEVAVFGPAVSPIAPSYTITFHLVSSVASGTTWGVVFGGQGYSSNTANLTIPGEPAGNYGISIDTGTAPGGLVEYKATPGDPVAYTVRQNATIDISFETFYWVAISSAVGGTVTPGNGFYASGSILYLVATANASYSFTGWAGTGTGNYSGTNATGSVLVSGPLTEVAEFQPSGATAAASTIWSQPGTWFGIGAVALIAGLVVGLLSARWGARSSRGTTRGTDGSTTPEAQAQSGGAR
jgi:Divergent InlB B-repeat domain